MKRFVLLSIVALVAAGCGQYVGVHAQAALPTQTVARQGPGGDIPDPSGPGAIRGDARVVQKAAHGKGSAKGSTKQGAGHRGKGSGKDSGSSLSRIGRTFALRNQRVLPAGFPFLICPVMGTYAYSDDFGAPRCTSGDASCGGYHLHMGNDLLSALGTPIVAPFDGNAVNSTNTVGGNAVSVYGAQGYVYNAHLVAFGQLGPVKAGTVVGFVGNTGDATGGPTHDHFEWHPNSMPSGLWRSAYGQSELNGSIDPYPYLRVVCPPR
ncbi:MAG: M23 family metallopeptidase [Actinomycetota bacterium]|nr:M23 family metallopeptidase [Actinomycetota bacterium]